MRKRCGYVGAVVSMVAAALAGGCTGPDKPQIEGQQQRIAELEGENSRLTRDLQAAIRDAQAAKQRLADMQRMLDEARAAKPGPAVPGWQQDQGVAWTNLADDILFDSGKADLKSSGRSRLQQVVGEIQKNFPDRNIFVVGHTDTDPIKHSKWKDNLDLSLARGRVVALELMSFGISAQQVVAAGQGEWNPIAGNDTRENKHKNRRVQVIAIHRPTAAEPIRAEAPGGE